MRGNFFYKRLGQNIEEARRKRQISQEELATLILVDRTYISRIEDGQANPTIKVLYKIAIKLRLKIEQLLAGV